ncbi:fumarylacetoacetate hydrolase family protein [Acinetobacter sp. FL51]|uniref:2-keto-4-pentenoate hydratase n=1 Tax=Acinetobacter sp. FL51 TaxID=2777978 RepID=UPI0018E0F742|nr:fumarylacetoacetate hydrolase family protein [Acinetobacter sp. FL51]MBI1453524.1 fumarylacetoacetate hydrolase family protein [Acinetobacter sp. FL51]
MPKTAEHFAQALFDAEQSRQAIAPICRALGEQATVDDAYVIQDINTERSLNNRRRLVGRKIGLTSVAVQKQLGVDSPDFGMLFEDMAYADGQTIAFSKLIQPKVEAEIALVLKADLTQEQHRIEDIIAATDYAVAAIEVVDSRIENWKISLLDTVADNASSAAFVLGQNKVQLSDLDLVNCQMQMTRAGEVVSTGVGKACLDNPLNAAVWLADEMVKRGRPLLAGDIVLTGALGPMVAVQAGESYQVEIEGLGQVTAVFSGE